MIIIKKDGHVIRVLQVAVITWVLLIYQINFLKKKKLMIDVRLFFLLLPHQFDKLAKINVNWGRKNSKLISELIRSIIH